MLRRFSTWPAFVVALALVAAVPVAAQTQSGTGAMPLPPGMTPQIMKMMMTPGPAHPAGLPKGVVPVAGCIPAMGYHYAKPKDWPMGPIYGWYDGKPVFTEVMIDKKKFDKGIDLDEVLKPLPGYKIDHVDIWYEPNGHPGMNVPHYDIHAWYIPHAAHMTFCKNASGKRPAFV